MTAREQPRPPALPPLARRLWSARGSAPARWLGLVLGVLLLALAVGAVWSNGAVVERAWSIGHDHPRSLALLLMLPLVSWLSTAATFWLLSQRYARVPLGDMAALIGAAWLLNHLPLRPGMIGRLAYHKKKHGMPVADSVRVMVSALALTGASLTLLLASALALPALDPGPLRLGALCSPLALAGLGALGGQLTRAPWRREAWAFFLRSLDMLTWVARYAIVFALVGEPIALERVVAVTLVGQFAMLVPLTGNGLGLREWAIGITLAALAAAGAREQAVAIGLTADLVNRAAETLLVVPVGLLCLLWLARAARPGGAPGDDSAESHPDPADPADVSVRTTDGTERGGPRSPPG